MNREAFDYCNINLWRSKGFTGKGIKIGIHDTDDCQVNKSFLDGKFHALYDRGNGKSIAHSVHCADIIHQISPDAEIYFLSGNYPGKDGYLDSLQWCIDNDVHLINMSRDWSTNEEIVKTEKIANDKGITFIVSAGNDGTNKMNESAKNGFFIPVASAELIDGKPVRNNYSSVGEELIVTGLTNLDVHMDGGNFTKFDGTSCSTPFCIGMVALWFQYFYEKNKRYPVQKEVVEFIKNNSEDMESDGKDSKTGYGLFRLPKEIDNMKIKMKIGSLNYTIDGKSEKFDVAPFIKENRTFLPVRALAEMLGCSVDYNDKTKEITIVKGE